MKIILFTLKKTLFWSYERGTWQYDLLCVLILAFIFFTPNDLFHKNAEVASRSAPTGNSLDEIPKRAAREGEPLVAPDKPRPRGQKAATAAK